MILVSWKMTFASFLSLPQYQYMEHAYLNYSYPAVYLHKYLLKYDLMCWLSIFTDSQQLQCTESAERYHN